MNAVEEIRARRAELLARAAVERERISVQLRTWEAPLALLDRGLAVVRSLRANPQWLIAGALVLAVLRPRRAFAWARNGLIAWRTWRWISSSLRSLAAR